MIIVSERPTIIGKLIHLNPQSYQSPRRIREALDQERPIEPNDHSKFTKPQGYPIGTVAVLNSIGNGTYYVMKRDNGYWQQITPPFQSFAEDIDGVDTTVLLTVIYNPHD
ncbi:hypothetical protein [uncultured Rothia sp.]|uniref:hypothetical protein n=1 Tax=uncultured Rothia sp. TaxID=316088 RepID=UPI0028DC814C|nr:hypothetical protein [uncultured Rothia sp.]